ncbi:hypothetical protein MSAN_00224000 [Mycena sanguinolenta]|uniref:Uncharacterized protein n=1 Tax=Mycena sanguinolenta TaxID=230812 RepID=A0A8H6ZJD3_9AGAR|nr:hypothetical protein MSAN_00224000 [Mycena sanguinolenta]
MSKPTHIPSWALLVSNATQPRFFNAPEYQAGGTRTQYTPRIRERLKLDGARESRLRRHKRIRCRGRRPLGRHKLQKSTTYGSRHPRSTPTVKVLKTPSAPDFRPEEHVQTRASWRERTRRRRSSRPPALKTTRTRTHMDLRVPDTCEPTPSRPAIVIRPTLPLRPDPPLRSAFPYRTPLSFRPGCVAVELAESLADSTRRAFLSVLKTVSARFLTQRPERVLRVVERSKPRARRSSTLEIPSRISARVASFQIDGSVLEDTTHERVRTACEPPSSRRRSRPPRSAAPSRPNLAVPVTYRQLQRAPRPYWHRPPSPRARTDVVAASSHSAPRSAASVTSNTPAVSNAAHRIVDIRTSSASVAKPQSPARAVRVESRTRCECEIANPRQLSSVPVCGASVRALTKLLVSSQYQTPRAPHSPRTRATSSLCEPAVFGIDASKDARGMD